MKAILYSHTWNRTIPILKYTESTLIKTIHIHGIVPYPYWNILNQHPSKLFTYMESYHTRTEIYWINTQVKLFTYRVWCLTCTTCEMSWTRRTYAVMRAPYVYTAITSAITSSSTSSVNAPPSNHGTRNSTSWLMYTYTGASYLGKAIIMSQHQNAVSF